MEMTEEEGAEGMRIIIKYAAAWAQRRGELFDKSKVAGQVGKFISRHFQVRDDTVDAIQHYQDCWAIQATTWCELACFAMSLGKAIVSEADVERSFLKQGLIFSKL